MEDDIKQINSLITRVFKNITEEDVQNASEINQQWKKTILSIKSSINPNEGQNLYDHSKIVDLKNGILLIEADHPGWIELLQMHKKYILTGMQRGAKVEIRTLAFRLKGSGVELKDTNSVEKYRHKMDEEQEFLNKRGFSPKKSAEKVNLPPELQNLFENLKNSMLTKNEE